MARIPTWLFAALILSSCGGASVQTGDPSVDLATAEMDTALGPGDVFDVRVYGEDDLSGTYRVAADGSIDFPLVGAVKVGDLTPSQASESIRARLLEGQYLRDPQVSILVKESRSKRISVFGQVRQAGTFPYESQMTVIHAITLAGGFSSIADKNNTTITRVVQGRPVRIRVPVEDIGQGEASDVVLRAGDVVFVPERIF